MHSLLNEAEAWGNGSTANDNSWTVNTQGRHLPLFNKERKDGCKHEMLQKLNLQKSNPLLNWMDSWIKMYPTQQNDFITPVF